jgi:hypothetical protein
MKPFYDNESTIVTFLKQYQINLPCWRIWKLIDNACRIFKKFFAFLELHCHNCEILSRWKNKTREMKSDGSGAF